MIIYLGMVIPADPETMALHRVCYPEFSRRGHGGEGGHTGKPQVVQEAERPGGKWAEAFQWFLQEEQARQVKQV